MTAADDRIHTTEPNSRFGGSLTLAQRYLVTGTIVVTLGAIIIGIWVSRQIENGVTQNAATATALYVDSFISPLTTELETTDTLSVGPILALDEVFQEGVLKDRLYSVKIWRADGTIVYSPDYDLIGQSFEPTSELIAASNGQISASFDALGDEEDARERKANIPLLEIYSPIRAPWSGKVIAVAEFYEDGTDLKRALAETRLKSWLVVAVVMAGVAGSLMTFVFWASRKIDSQQAALHDQLNQVSFRSEQNRRLRERLQQASGRVTELNERFLKRTSADLHDGPAQLLSFASLRLGEARKINSKERRDEELVLIEQALGEAMRDIRNVCKGLSLPDIDNLSIQQTIKRVVKSVSARTKHKVDVDLPPEAIFAATPINICVFRFVQEALNNSFKHAPESRSRVICGLNDSRTRLELTVEDSGPGFEFAILDGDADGLGLGGLQERIRSIGGDLLIESSPENGTRLTMSVQIDKDANDG
jgi:signal transduction histidine kinase